MREYELKVRKVFYIIMFMLGVGCLAGCSDSRSFEKAQKEYEEGDFIRVQTYLLDALAKDDNDPKYYVAYGNLLLEENEYKAAVNIFEYICTGKIEAEDEIKQKAFLGQGIALLRSGKPDEAIPCFYASITSEDDAVMEDDMLSWLGEAHSLAGQLEEAEKNYTELIQRKPEDGSLYAVRGGIRFKLLKLEESVKDYEQAFALKQTSFDVYYGYYETLLALSRTKEAEAVMKQAIGAGYGEVYFYLAERAVKQEQWEEALDLYNKYTALGEYLEEASYQRAEQQKERIPIYLLEQEGKFEKARALLVTYKEKWGDDSQIEQELVFLENRMR